jgi:hypothetical protein
LYLQSAAQHRKKPRHQEWLDSLTSAPDAAVAANSIVAPSVAIVDAASHQASPIANCEVAASDTVLNYSDQNCAIPSTEWSNLQLVSSDPTQALEQHWCDQHMMYYLGTFCSFCEMYPNVYLRQGNVGFQSGGCADGHHAGDNDDCCGCRMYAEECRQELAAGPLRVVLTGTFPELGGGRGFEIGKAKLSKMVTDTAHGRVLSKISSKTTHLVKGKNPGRAKLLESEKFPFMRILDYETFVAIIEDKVQNPPVLPSKSQILAKKAAKALNTKKLYEAARARDAEFQSEWAQMYSNACRVRPEPQQQQTQVYPKQRCTVYLITHLQPSLAAAPPPQHHVVANPNPILQQYLAIRDLNAMAAQTADESQVNAPLLATEPAANLCPRVQSSSDGIDHTIKHYKYFRIRSWALLECGGAGDCFFYSVLFLNKLNTYTYPDMRRTHSALRKQLFVHFREHQDKILANHQPITAFLEARPKNYLQQMSNPGEFVEYETLCAFSHMVQAPVVVWSKDCDAPLSIFPDGRAIGERESVPSTIFKLWTNGGHYQALAAVAQCKPRQQMPLPIDSFPHTFNARDILFQ